MKHLLFSLPKDLKFVLNAVMFRKHLSVPYSKHQVHCLRTVTRVEGCRPASGTQKVLSKC